MDVKTLKDFLLAGRTNNSAFTLAVVLLYACMVFFIIPHHEPWRDETDGWVAVSDLGFWELFEWYGRTTGRPGLWNLIMLPFAKAGLPFGTIYVLHAAIAIAMVGVFVRYAPFSALTKILWAFSMPIAFEYSVVARDYGLAALCLFLVGAAYPRRFDKPFRYAAAIFLLLQTLGLVFMTGCAIVLCYTIELWQKRKEITNQHAIAWVLMGASVLAALLLLVSPKEFALGSVANTGNFGLFPGRSVISSLSDGWLPGLFALAKELSGTMPLLSAFLLAASIFLPAALIGAAGVEMSESGKTLRRFLPAIVFLLSLLWFSYVDFFKLSLTMRHHVLLLQVFLLSVWMVRATAPEKTMPHGKDKLALLLNLCLFYAVLQTPFHYAREYQYPFSASRGVVEFLKTNQLDTRTLVVDRLFSLVPLVDRATCVWHAYQQECRRVIEWRSMKYWEYFYKSPFGKENKTLKLAAGSFGDFTGKVFILCRPLSKQEVKRYKLALVYYGAGMHGEEAWIYLPQKDLGKIGQGKYPRYPSPAR